MVSEFDKKRQVTRQAFSACPFRARQSSRILVKRLKSVADLGCFQVFGLVVTLLHVFARTLAGAESWRDGGSHSFGPVKVVVDIGPVELEMLVGDDPRLE